MRITGFKEVSANLKIKANDTDKGVEEGIERATLLLLREVKQSIAGRKSLPVTVDTSLFLNSTYHLVKGKEGAVYNDVEYACVVGAYHSVYEPTQKTCGSIGKYKYDYVLSKDGIPHEIEKRMSFKNKDKEKIECVSIKINNKINPLLLTLNHMVLVLRNEELQWMKAKNLTYEDFVFRKRPHNAIMDNSNKKKFVCKCGKEFWVEKSLLKNGDRKFCSMICRHKFGRHDNAKGKKWRLTLEQRKKHMGKNNPQWKGGVAKSPYDWRFNKYLKEEVKKRDNYTCQKCGRSKDEVMYLLVHHKDFDKMNSDIDNLVTLCPNCHGKYNRIDCSLPDVNLKVFKPIKIKELKKNVIIKGYRSNLPKLYDLMIKDENSFVAGGILIHNSFIEFGTKKMKKRPHFRVSKNRIQDKINVEIAKAISDNIK